MVRSKDGSVCIKIKAHDSATCFGRHFDEKDEIISKVKLYSYLINFNIIVKQKLYRCTQRIFQRRDDPRRLAFDCSIKENFEYQLKLKIMLYKNIKILLILLILFVID